MRTIACSPLQVRATSPCRLALSEVFGARARVSRNSFRNSVDCSWDTFPTPKLGSRGGRGLVRDLTATAVGVGGGGGGGDPSEVETTCGADSTLTSTPPLLSAVWSEAREARMPDESAAFVEVAVASSATAMTSVTATEAEVIVRLTLLTPTPAVCAKTTFRAVLLAAS
jgi:hypothetical protein